MQIMNVQQFRMAETPQGTSPVTAPSFGMAKVKVPREVTKKGIEAGAALLATSTAALTGHVLVNKAKQRPTVNEIINDSLKVLDHELPELTKEELKELDTNCDKAIKKCDKYLKSKKSPTVEMYKDFLERERPEIKR